MRTQEPEVNSLLSIKLRFKNSVNCYEFKLKTALN